MPVGEVQVRGFRELNRACRRTSLGAEVGLRKELREGGKIVRDDAARRFSRYSEKSASKYGVSLRDRGLSVEQRLRKVTGKRPDWGALQMREALLPAREAHSEEILLRVDAMLGRLGGEFDSGL